MCCQGFVFVFVFCLRGGFGAVEDRPGLELKWACFQTPAIS